MHSHDNDPAARYGDAMRSDSARVHERQRRRYGTRRGRGTWIWWAVAIGGLIVFAALMWAVMEKTKWTSGDLARATSAMSRPAIGISAG